ncbi:MAG: hypothetical protein J7K58_01415 [Euryarchaeota archaeon]|nr:hypothetical protein [Euryarchaeota archaeon]
MCALGIDERVLERIRTQLRKIYIQGLNDNIIDSGFVVSFYVSANKLVLSVDQRVLRPKTLTPQHIKALEKDLMEVIAMFGFKGLRIQDVRGNILLDRMF